MPKLNLNEIAAGATVMTSLGQHLLHAVTKKNSNKQLQNNE